MHCTSGEETLAQTGCKDFTHHLSSLLVFLRVFFETVESSKINYIPSDDHTYRDLDRSNLGNARLQGLPEDVLGGDLTGVLFDWLVAILYIPYVSRLDGH